MRKLTFSFLVPAVVAFSSLTGCHVEVGTEDPHHPHNPPPPPAQSGTTKVMSNAGAPIRTVGKPAPTPGTTPTPTPTAPAGSAIVTSGTVFGNNTQSATGYKGSIYFIPAGSTTIPNLSSLTPSGYLFTPTLNVAAQPFSSGFPGVGATNTTNFAIRYVAPLTVTTEADYDFRVNADDGAVVSIDGTTIVDNNGVHTTATSKDGPVHLVTGAHVIQVDYFQTTGTVALQLFCKKSGAGEQICPTSL